MHISPARPDDLNAMATLLEEMDRFYGATDDDIEPQDHRLAQIRDALFGDIPAARALLAWNRERLGGLATYSFLWPAEGLTRSLYLKELYVAKDYRRTSVGLGLMTVLRRVAKQHQCSRIEFTTDSDNPQAQRFYSAIGAVELPSKVFYRFR